MQQVQHGGPPVASGATVYGGKSKQAFSFTKLNSHNLCV